MKKIILLCSIMFFSPEFSEGRFSINPDDTVSVIIEMDNFSFEPSTVEIPAGKIVELKFTNVGSDEHEFMAGHNITEDRDGYNKDLFHDVEVKKFKNGKLIKEPDDEHGTEIVLYPDETGSLVFNLPESKKGEWDMGCFINLGGGTHYQMGMSGKLIVK
jgi:plastocyanin